jgi:hypothetical protein
VPITTDGITTLSYFAADKVGNEEQPRTLVVRIDKTAPEAVARFDPARQDVVVLGRDAGSGVPAGPVATGAVTRSREGELRTYTLRDAADNELVLKAQVNKDGHELKANIVSLQYNGGPVGTVGLNRLEFEWELDQAGGCGS